MIAAVVVLGVVCVALAAALIAETRRSQRERAALMDVVVARHAGELRTLRAAPAEEAAKRDYEKELEADLKAMGYEPGTVPRLPSGL